MASLRFVVLAAVLMSAAAELSPQDKVVERVEASEVACRDIDNDPCALQCKLKYMGILEKDGRYVESKAAEVIAVGIRKGLLTQEQINKVAKGCNSLNEHITTGCDRSEQVMQCFDKEFKKVLPGLPDRRFVLKLKA